MESSLPAYLGSIAVHWRAEVVLGGRDCQLLPAAPNLQCLELSACNNLLDQAPAGKSGQARVPDLQADKRFVNTL